MATLFYSNRAVKDLREIHAYIAADNRAAALHLLDRLKEKCAQLAEFPLSGRARPELGKELRYIPVGNYVILYRIVSDDIHIVRVMHGAQNFESF